MEGRLKHKNRDIFYPGNALNKKVQTNNIACRSFLLPISSNLKLIKENQ